MDGRNAPNLDRLCFIVYVLYALDIILLTTMEALSHEPKFDENIQGQVIEQVIIMLFLIDSLMKKNILQMKAYVIMKIYTLFNSIYGFNFSVTKFSMISFGLRSIMFSVKIAIVCALVGKFSQIYNWYYFKRLGANAYLRGKFKT